MRTDFVLLLCVVRNGAETSSGQCGVVSAALLDGFVVAVTADRRSDEQVELLHRHGARTLHGATLRTLPIVADGELRATTDDLIANPPDLVLANTGIGMRAWLSAADSWGLGEELGAVLRASEIVARGPKAAGSLVTIGCEVSWRATGRLSDVVAHLLERPLSGLRIAVQRDGSDLDEAATALRAAGADVVAFVTYKWFRPEDETATIRLLDACCSGTVDAITFTSRPAIQNLFALAAERDQVDALLGACAKRVLPVCVGPVCYEAAIDHGLNSAIAPQRALLGAMVNALVDVVGQRRTVVMLAAGELVVSGTVATLSDTRIELSGREAAVLQALAARAGAVVSKSALLREVWGDPDADGHALEVTVSRLRKQLGSAGNALRTVVRRGYMLALD